ncbi:MAG: Na+/H+ antiporter NhaA [Saprospiraceae bacterium]|nr:Na+/H+ antiporter NhaA [Saprospiraceae bacterium]
MRNVVAQLYKDFFQSEKTAGLLLMLATVFSLCVANSAFGDAYKGLFQFNLWGHSLTYWINDALMAIFFLLVGLEIERELFVGELADFKNSMLPVSAALGGMIVPAFIFLSINFGTDYSSGFGIPMATDIAFSLGILALLGTRIHISLKIFLTALAIIDDLGAILVIAFAYNSGLNGQFLMFSGGLIALMLLMRKTGFNKWWYYILPGIGLWFTIHEAGIHSTISGVILAFLIPFKKDDDHCPSFKLQHLLHKPVAYFILPLFALANTALLISNDDFVKLSSPLSLGIILGLVAGKPIGILLFSYVAVKSGIANMLPNLSWKHILAIGFLAGIGFTMSIFISLLALPDETSVNLSKLSILVASLIAATIGYLMLRFQFGKKGKRMKEDGVNSD